MNSENASWLNSKEGPRRCSNSEKAWSSVAFQEHLAQQFKVNLSIPKFRSNNRTQKVQSKCSRCNHRASEPPTRSLNRLKPIISGIGGVEIKRNKNTSNTLYTTVSEVEYPLSDANSHQLSLAQKLGLVERPPSLLTEEEWMEIKGRSNNRLDSSSPCPICKDHFQLQPQLLLSCSHIFHKSCIESYERFVKCKICPVCRCEDYQGRVVYEGAKCTRERAAILIQSCWRGHRAKRDYRKLQEKHPPTHPALRKKFFSKKLAALTDLYMDQCAKREEEIDSFIDQLDSTLSYSRKTLASLDQHLNSLDTSEWLGVREKAMKREDSECPICLTELFGSKDVSLLSCSHLFHSTCIDSFEQFAAITPFACPVCRGMYQKIIITR